LLKSLAISVRPTLRHISRSATYCQICGRPHIWQNGKQERVWGHLEGRLIAMLEGVSELTLDLLNNATHAWIEREYHQTRHAELG
jgi:hypothetical protein